MLLMLFISLLSSILSIGNALGCDMTCEPYKITFNGTAARLDIRGKYTGVWQQRSVVLEFVNPISNVYSNANPPLGRLEYAGRTYDFVCNKTVSLNRYEVRLKRPANPVLLGEYLEWRAYLDIGQSGSLKLTVYSDLSSVERLKYTLPGRGAVISLSSVEAGNVKFFPKTTTFCYSSTTVWVTYVFYPDGTCTVDGGVNEYGIVGEWTRGHGDGRYYIKDMIIYSKWENDVRSEFNLKNGGDIMEVDELRYERQ